MPDKINLVMVLRFESCFLMFSNFSTTKSRLRTLYKLCERCKFHDVNHSHRWTLERKALSSWTRTPQDTRYLEHLFRIWTGHFYCVWRIGHFCNSPYICNMPYWTFVTPFTLLYKCTTLNFCIHLKPCFY